MVVLTFPLTSRMLQSFLPVTFVLTNEICIKMVWAEKVYFFRKTFFRDKKHFLTHFFPPPPKKRALVKLHSYHVF